MGGRCAGSYWGPKNLCDSEEFYQRFASRRAYVSQFHEYMKLHTSARERGPVARS
jgi:hypothetical protein